MTSLVSSVPDSTEFNAMMMIAKAAVASQKYPKEGNESAIFLKLLAARELGVTFTEAITGGIHCFDGKMELSPRLLNGLIRRHGHKIETIRISDTECVLRGIRAGSGETEESSFTMADAVKAGLDKKDNWKKYAQDMLYARAMSRLARRLFADVIGNAYVEGEVIDVPTTQEPRNLNIGVGQPGFQVVAPMCVDKPPEPILTAEQSHNLQSKLILCSQEFQDRFKKLVFERFNISDLSLIPLDRYEKMMASIENNIETQKQIADIPNET